MACVVGPRMHNIHLHSVFREDKPEIQHHNEVHPFLPQTRL
jgi:hypothetical protein